jgi:hypothetical protein
MTHDTNPAHSASVLTDTVLDSVVLGSHLVAVFNERAFGTLADWSMGARLRSETIHGLRGVLDGLAVATNGTIGLSFTRELASATGVAMAVSCRVGDDDADTSADRAMVRSGAEVLSMYLDDTERVWATLDDAARGRWRLRLGERIAAVTADLDDGPDDAVTELASCTAVAAALTAHDAWSSVDGQHSEV